MKDKLPIEMLLAPTSSLASPFLYHSRSATSARAFEYFVFLVTTVFRVITKKEEALSMASIDFMTEEVTGCFAKDLILLEYPTDSRKLK